MSDRIPLSVPDLRGNEAAYLAQCVADNWVSSAGPFIGDCEDRLATLTGRAHAVATVNGTAALHLALLGAGIQPGDFVIVPDWTFAATANAVFHAGARPVFVDVTDATWSLDPALVERVLNDPPGRIAAVIAVHPLGHPADVDPLALLCKRAGVPLIEDAAGALGARYKDRPVGGLGDIAIFSFNGNKTVTAGGGGMVVTDDNGRAKRLRHLTTQARVGADYMHDAIGFNYRMTNINAGVLLAQLERLDDMLAAKREIAAGYDAALAGREDLCPMPRADWAVSSNWLYSVRCNNEAKASALVGHLNDSGIEARIFWRSLSPQPPYAGGPVMLSGVAAALSGTVVSLPSSSSLGADAQARVIEALGAWGRQ